MKLEWFPLSMKDRQATLVMCFELPRNHSCGWSTTLLFFHLISNRNELLNPITTHTKFSSSPNDPSRFCWWVNARSHWTKLTKILSSFGGEQKKDEQNINVVNYERSFFCSSVFDKNHNSFDTVTPLFTRPLLLCRRLTVVNDILYLSPPASTASTRQC